MKDERNLDFSVLISEVRAVMERLGIDLEDENFKDTPSRFAIFLSLFTLSKESQETTIKSFFKKKFRTKNSEIVLVSGRFYSLCPHHLLPVEYDYWIGYIPVNYAIGLSKFQRIVEILGGFPQLQEDLTTKIANVIQENLEPAGVGVLLTGKHFCMRMRGVKSYNSEVTTSHLVGVFKKPEVKSEFLKLVEFSKKG